ncbi:MAG: fibronectin type III domain-containing protein [Salinispira sp.]
MAAPTLESGNAILTAAWTAPDDGGSAITGYELQYRTGGGAWTEMSSGIGTNTSHTITGLTNGNTYEVQVRAVNAQGPSAWSTSATATPAAVPAAPDTPTLESDTGQITATWIAPDDGGSAITEYHVQHKLSADDWPTDNTTSISAITVAAPATTHTIMNLENGMSYDVRVRAANAQGNGAWSPSQSAGLKFVGAYDESKDFDSLDMAGTVINSPYGIWSDGTTMWVADLYSGNRKIYAYKMSDKTRMSGSDINVSYQPLSIWSDGETMWVVEGKYGSHANIHAHNRMSNGNFDPMPDTNKSFTVSGAPYPVSGVYYSDIIPAGIWSNGTTMWVADTNGGNKKIYAYKLSTGEADSAKDINLSDDLGRLEGIWSDGTTLWIVDDVTITDDMGTDVMRTRMAAYKMSDGTSDPTKTFTLNDIENIDNTGIWSDGRTMWIASDVNGSGTSTTPPITAGGAKLYAYTLFEEY